MFGSGKCFKKDCGCQKFWQKPDSLDVNICGCDHYEAFHEQKPTGEDYIAENKNLLTQSSNVSSRNLLTGGENLFLASNQEIDTARSDNIRAFLRSEEIKGRLTAVSTASNSSNRLNFNLQKESSKYKLNFKGKPKKNKIRAISYDFTLIPKKSISCIPKRGNELWEQLLAQNLLLQKITFNQNGEEYVNNQVVSVFPCLIETGWVCYKVKNTSELEETPLEPNDIKDLDYIKRASTSKSKVYIKPIIDNLCESSDDSSTDFSTNSSTEEEITELPNGSLQSLMKGFQDRYTNDNISIININENFIVETLIQWAKAANDNDLLQRPSINLVLEDVTDTGGVFKQIISIFWMKILECDLYFTDGIIDNSIECHTLGKLLFWTILHCGHWPQWLNKFHIKYFIDEEIEYEKILKECNPISYKLYRQLKKAKRSDLNKLLHSWVNNRDINIDIKSLNNKEAASYVAKYEVVSIREKALDDFKLGFDRFNIINELKNYKYHNIVRELYYKLSYDIVIDQFDNEYIEYQAQTNNKPQYQLLFEKFKDLLRSMNEEELKTVMKFATGASIIPASPKIKISWVKLNIDEAKLWYNRLPHASTCGNLLTLCENYEMSLEGFDTFKEDLRIGFMNHEGFSEPVYSRNYNSNFILQNEINNELQGSSNSQSNSTATGTPMQSAYNVDSPSTMRSTSFRLSGDTADNAISIEDNASTDSYQNINSNVRQMVTYRWVNVTNPLERRTRRRESADF